MLAPYLTIRDEVVSATNKKFPSGDTSSPFGIKSPLTRVRAILVFILNEISLPRPVASSTAYLLLRLAHFQDESVKYSVLFSPTPTSFINLTGIPSTTPSCGNNILIFLLWRLRFRRP